MVLDREHLAAIVRLSVDMATRIDVQYYKDARDALLKAIVE
jgi:hypothetical protein